MFTLYCLQIHSFDFAYLILILFIPCIYTKLFVHNTNEWTSGIHAAPKLSVFTVLLPVHHGIV
jgi:hypothetical protein